MFAYLLSVASHHIICLVRVAHLNYREAGGDVFTATLNTLSKDQFVQAFVACVLPFLPPRTGEF